MVKDQSLLNRITRDPDVMAGKAVIRGTRLTVELILHLLAHGATVDDILQEYEGLTQEDVSACLLYAATSLEGQRPILLPRIRKGLIPSGSCRCWRTTSAHEILSVSLTLWPAFFIGARQIIFVQQCGDKPCLLVVRQGPGFDLYNHPHYDPQTGNVEWTRELTPEQSREVLAQLSSLTLPVAPDWATGLDGSTWELEIGAGSNSSILHWWGGVPQCWQGVASLVETLERLGGVKPSLPCLRPA